MLEGPILSNTYNSCTVYNNYNVYDISWSHTSILNNYSSTYILNSIDCAIDNIKRYVKFFFVTIGPTVHGFVKYIVSLEVKYGDK